MALHCRVLLLCGSSGIGRATVRCLTADGAGVLFTRHTGAERAEWLCADVAPRGRTIACDVRRRRHTPRPQATRP